MTKKSCKLSLPLPTSLNKLYIQQFSGGRPTGKKILSKAGKENRMDIMINVEKQMSLPMNVDWDIEYTRDNYIFMDIDAYVTRINVDLDNTLKSLNDSIEESGLVFINDKKVVPRFNRVYIDATNPRLELTFTQTGWHGIFNNQQERDKFESKCQLCSRYRNGVCSILKKTLENKLIEDIIEEDNQYTCSKFKEKK
ncbi:RusA family crossover junction endodeoxyribonuclease [Staphylococcus pseudintermedius]|nr:RusA family crossover junction endodeoxyribonuclease [Staphylococcus pseudintermedius]EHT3692701.1 RusA family crossover junction endodeoxyribonuclease [Staphylococcus pseudintermedius]